MRALALAIAAAALAGCAGNPHHTGRHVPAYTALQLIDTTPGPFRNRLYVDGDRERQDAALGGGTVTTIIRRDRGVAWLLIPAWRQYEEIPLADAMSASVDARFAGLERRRLGMAVLETGIRATHYAWHATDGRLVAWSWVDADGITHRAEWPADPDAGTPAAVLRLEDIHRAPQDPALFELPAGYTRRP